MLYTLQYMGEKAFTDGNIIGNQMIKPGATVEVDEQTMGKLQQSSGNMFEIIAQRIPPPTKSQDQEKTTVEKRAKRNEA